MPNIATGLRYEYNANCDSDWDSSQTWTWNWNWYGDWTHTPLGTTLGCLVNISTSCRTRTTTAHSFWVFVSFGFGFDFDFGYLLPHSTPHSYRLSSCLRHVAFFTIIIILWSFFLYFYRCGILTPSRIHKAPDCLLFGIMGPAANWELFLCMNCVKKLVIICSSPDKNRPNRWAVLGTVFWALSLRLLLR